MNDLFSMVRLKQNQIDSQNFSKIKSQLRIPCSSQFNMNSKLSGVFENTSVEHSKKIYYLNNYILANPINNNVVTNQSLNENFSLPLLEHNKIESEYARMLFGELNPGNTKELDNNINKQGINLIKNYINTNKQEIRQNKQTVLEKFDKIIKSDCVKMNENIEHTKNSLKKTANESIVSVFDTFCEAYSKLPILPKAPNIDLKLKHWSSNSENNHKEGNSKNMDLLAGESQKNCNYKAPLNQFYSNTKCNKTNQKTVIKNSPSLDSQFLKPCSSSFQFKNITNQSNVCNCLGSCTNDIDFNNGNNVNSNTNSNSNFINSFNNHYNQNLNNMNYSNQNNQNEGVNNIKSLNSNSSSINFIHPLFKHLGSNMSSNQVLNNLTPENFMNQNLNELDLQFIQSNNNASIFFPYNILQTNIINNYTFQPTPPSLIHSASNNTSTNKTVNSNNGTINSYKKMSKNTTMSIKFEKEKSDVKSRESDFKPVQKPRL